MSDTGGAECNDHKRIWDALDKALARYPDMVLLHGATPKGAERIAACWAESRKITQVAFKPDWTKHAKAAPFRRNDQLLATMPKGVIIFPGSGITGNLADNPQHLLGVVGLRRQRHHEEKEADGEGANLALQRAPGDLEGVVRGEESLFGQAAA